MELLRNSLAEPRIQMRIILACIEWYGFTVFMVVWSILHAIGVYQLVQPRDFKSTSHLDRPQLFNPTNLRCSICPFET